MRMAPPPAEVARAEQELNAAIEADTAPKSYRLIPSKVAIEQALAMKMKVADNDIPLFVADRLAFSGPKGTPQLPLFVDKADCIYSYQRLREGKQSLPEEPNVRSTTLMEEVYSMEKGTRPGVSQLAFYATAQDLNKAVDLVQ
jgi:hypothetical protein